MAISFTCSCGKKLKVADTLLGKKVKCPDCQKVTQVTAEAAAAPAKAAAKPGLPAKPAAAAPKPAAPAAKAAAAAKPAPPPAKSKPTVPAAKAPSPPEESFDDEEEAPKPAKKKPAPADEEPDLDALFSGGDEEEAAPPPTRKKGKPADEEPDLNNLFGDNGDGGGEEEEEAPRAKKKSRPLDDEEEEPAFTDDEEENRHDDEEQEQEEEAPKSRKKPAKSYDEDEEEEAPPPPKGKKGKKPVMDDEEDMPPEDEDEDEAPKKGKKKTPPKKKSSPMFLIIVLVLVLLIGAGALVIFVDPLGFFNPPPIPGRPGTQPTTPPDQKSKEPAKADWKETVVKDAKFSFKTPGEPTPAKEGIKYVLDVKIGKYIVESTTTADSAKDIAKLTEGLTEVTAEKPKFGETEGQEFESKEKGKAAANVRMRIFVADDRLIMIAVKGTADFIKSDDAKTFFKSLTPIMQKKMEDKKDGTSNESSFLPPGRNDRIRVGFAFPQSVPGNEGTTLVPVPAAMGWLPRSDDFAAVRSRMRSL